VPPATDGLIFRILQLCPKDRITGRWQFTLVKTENVLPGRSGTPSSRRARRDAVSPPPPLRRTGKLPTGCRHALTGPLFATDRTAAGAIAEPASR